MSQFRFSSGVVSDLTSWGDYSYSSLADYRIIRNLVKELTWSKDHSLKTLQNDIRMQESCSLFSFPVSPDSMDQLLIGLVGAVEQVHNYFPGDGSNTVAYRNRNFGCFSTREIVAMSRLWQEYHSSPINLFQGLALNGLYLARDVHKRSKAEFWWPTDHIGSLSADYAYKLSDDLVVAMSASADLKRRLKA